MFAKGIEKGHIHAQNKNAPLKSEALYDLSGVSVYVLAAVTVTQLLPAGIIC